MNIDWFNSVQQIQVVIALNFDKDNFIRRREVAREAINDRWSERNKERKNELS